MISIIRSMLLLVTVCFASCNGASKAGGRTWWPSQCGNKVTNVVNGDTLTIDYRCDEDSYTMIHMKNDYYHGLFKRWDKNGILRSRIDYCRDRFCGDVIGWDTAGNILTEKKYNSSGEPIGFHREFYSADHPKRFTNFNDQGDKHGWEIFWYDNGNVKDSILFRNDSTMQRRSYYYNGKPQMFEDDIYATYDAVSFNPKGKRTGKIKDGTGTVSLCDSVGGDCKELKYKDGKRVLE